jgi:hypothetical protein
MGVKAACALFGLMMLSQTMAQHIFVSVFQGDDIHGDGSSAHPFASIARGQQAVRTILAGTKALTSNITVMIAGGQYYVPEGLKFDSQDSGRDGFKVVYSGSDDGTTEVFGGARVHGWAVDPNDAHKRIWYANVSELTSSGSAPAPAPNRFFMLLSEGEAAVLARTPDEGSGYLKELGCKNSDSSISCPKGVFPAALSQQAADASVFANLGADWFTDTRKVKTIVTNADGSTGITFDGGKTPHLDASKGFVPRYPRNTSAHTPTLSMGANDKVFN